MMSNRCYVNIRSAYTLLFVFVTTYIGWAIYRWGQIGVVVRSFGCARSWFRKSTIYTCIVQSLIHTQLSMTSTKRSGSKLISGSSGLTWEGAAKSNSWRWVERMGQYKMKWAVFLLLHVNIQKQKAAAKKKKRKKKTNKQTNKQTKKNNRVHTPNIE